MEETASDRQWVDLGPAADLKPGSLRKVEVNGLALALGWGASGPFCLADACAHEGASLSRGSLEGDSVTCPLHGYKYHAPDGACLTDSRLCQQRFEVKLEGGRLLAALPPAASAPAADPATQKSSVELWKSEKHGLDCWPDILAWAKAGTPMRELSVPEMERMKWFGFFYRKTNDLDRYMVRIRIPGCAMNAAQLRTMAFIAYESGHSILDVTTRGNIQIQGLPIQKLPGVAAALEAVGLTAKQSGHDNVRNITSLPLAGIDPEELIDTRPFAEALQAMIIDSREFSDLPRKFNPAFCGRERAAAHVWTQDLSFVAGRKEDGTVAFRLLLGGTQGQTPTLAWCAPVWVRPEEVLELSAAVLRVYRMLGWRHNRHEVRLHFLMERIGNEAFLEKVEETLGRSLEPCRLPMPPAEREENYVGWHLQKGASGWQARHWALGVCVPVGRLSWEQARGLADLAETFGDGGIRSTLDQNLILTGIPESLKAEAEQALAALGLSHESDSVTRQMVACTGRQFCNLAISETKGHALWLMEALRRRRVQLNGISIHMSGCPNSCGMTLTADIGLQGTKARRNNKVVDAFDVFLGGGADSAVQLGILFKKAVPVDELPYFLQNIIAEYRRGRSKGQGFSAYWRERLKEHVAAPADAPERWWLCGQCGYAHAGEVPPVFCPACMAIRSKFDPAPDGFDAATYRKGASAKPGVRPVAAPRPAEPAPRRLVIVGSGIAAHTAAQEARRLDPKATILLVGAESAFYNRLNLTRLLAGELERSALFDFGADWAKAQRVEARYGVAVNGIDPVARVLKLADGSRLDYDACILAHGASPSLPAFWREGMGGLAALRRLEDFDTVRRRLRPGEAVAVVGGGVLGVEAAFALASQGARVVLIELMDRLMPRQLDAEAAEMLRARAEAAGIRVLLGQGVRELRGAEEVERLILADGSELAVHQVLVSAGVEPNTAWLRAAGLACGRGVTVDDRMATSAPDVYACGDVAEWRGRVCGLWTHAQEQAQVAAASALGRPAAYTGTLPVTILKCAGVDCVSIGEIPVEGPGVDARTLSGEGSYRRLYLRHGLPVGAILYGDAGELGEWRKLVEDGLALEFRQRRLLPLEALVAS